MASAGYFLLFFTGSVALADAATRLGQRLHVSRADDGLTVRWNSDSEPVLRVTLDGGEHVAAEATEIADLHGLPALAGLDRRFQVSFDDLEAVLDEANTLIEVQITLQVLTGGYLFLPWNDNVLAPE